jgi:outer membrane protein TolC
VADAGRETTVVANLVLAVVQQAALSDQVAAQREAIASARGVLDLLKKRQALGAVGASDIAAQETQLATAKRLCRRWSAASCTSRH